LVTRLGLRATARELGISHVALLKAESDGRVPKRVGGLFAVEACRKALGLNSQPVKSRAARSQSKPATPAGSPAFSGDVNADTSPQGSSMAEAARQLEWAKVRALEQKIDREQGRLVEIVGVNAFVAGMIMKARDELVRIGAEIADKLSQEIDPAKCRAHVDDRVFQVLANLKEYKPAA
jgi:hypothetical protein